MKNYISALVLLFTAGAVVAQTGLNCLSRAAMECGPNPIQVMPATAEELKTACKANQEYVKCNADFYATCDTTVRKAPLEYRYLEHLKIGCNESDESYAAISRNLGCIASKLNESRNICKREGIRADIQNFFQAIGPSVTEGKAEDFGYCGHVLAYQTCRAIAVGRVCGEELENPAFEMMKNTFPQFSYYCDDDVFRLMEPHLGPLRDAFVATIEAWEQEK